MLPSPLTSLLMNLFTSLLSTCLALGLCNVLPISVQLLLSIPCRNGTMVSVPFLGLDRQLHNSLMSL